MFAYTIDRKGTVTDNNGNLIVNLADSIFSKKSTADINYTKVMVTSDYKMRPDLVSFYEYGTDDFTEFILKFSGISNPFSFDEDDILYIPDTNAAANMMVDNTENIVEENSVNKDVLIKNYYKFSNNKYKNDTTSYDNLLNSEIPSGNVNTAELGNATTPYINAGNGTGISIRNGKIYFGENTGLTSAGLINKSLDTTESINDAIKNIINNTASELADNCLLNGTSLSTFVRANLNSQSEK